jgi:hypothetical protein
MLHHRQRITGQIQLVKMHPNPAARGVHRHNLSKPDIVPTIATHQVTLTIVNPVE